MDDGSWRFSLRSMFVIITLVGIGLALPGELTLVVAAIAGIGVLVRWLWGDPREWMLLGVAVYVLLGLLRLCIDVAR